MDWAAKVITTVRKGKDKNTFEPSKGCFVSSLIASHSSTVVPLSAKNKKPIDCHCDLSE